MGRECCALVSLLRASFQIMRPQRKEPKPRTGLRSMGRSSFIKIIPMDTVKHSKCAICLERIQDVTYLNPCKHRFCFECVQAWSRKKVACPLCKEHFHSFFHTVGGKGVSYEYVLPLKGSLCSHPKSKEGHTPASSQRVPSPPDNGIVHDGITGKLTQKENEIYQLMRQFAVRRRPAQAAVISLGKFKAQAVLHFRRAIYLAGIRVQSAQNPEIHRVASAEYFSQNPGCFDRLIPWLRRELKVLCGNQRPLVHTLQGFILKSMTQHDLQSKKFEALLQPYFRHFTTHFLNEFVSFALSPYSMKKYDWHASYEYPPPMREESDLLISSASSDNEYSQPPTNDQIIFNINPDERKQGSLKACSERELTALFTAVDSLNHSKNEENNFKDLSDSDPEQEVHTADVFTKNKLHVLQLTKKGHPEQSFHHAQMLHYMKENEDAGDMHLVQTHHSTDLEAYKSPSNRLASGDYVALNCNHSNIAGINSIQITKQDPTKSQCLDFPTNHFRSSSERMIAPAPGRKIVFQVDDSRSAQCSFEKGYVPPKERPGKRSRRRCPHEGRGYGNYSREGRVRREQRKGTSSNGSLVGKTTLSFKSENIVARDINKGKTQKPRQFRKLRNKDCESCRDKEYSEPNWKRVYYRQDCERYRYEEPLDSKGGTTIVSSPKPLVNSRAKTCFSLEGKCLMDQGSVSKGQDHYLERCRSVGRPKDKLALVGQERRPYHKPGGKRRHKS